jgi:hypothetical protein
MGVPDFMSKLIAGEIADNPGKRLSFEEILNEFEDNEFKMVAGVDTSSADAFTTWVDEARLEN